MNNSMNSNNVLVLTIKGIGNVPSFKNSKVIGRLWGKGGKKGRPILLTAPKKKKWMQDAEAQLNSQLNSTTRTTETAIQMEWLLRLLKSSVTRYDDSVKWTGRLIVDPIPVSKGQEGAMIMMRLLEQPEQIHLKD